MIKHIPLLVICLHLVTACIVVTNDPRNWVKEGVPPASVNEALLDCNDQVEKVMESAVQASDKGKAPYAKVDHLDTGSRRFVDDPFNRKIVRDRCMEQKGFHVRGKKNDR